VLRRSCNSDNSPLAVPRVCGERGLGGVCFDDPAIVMIPLMLCPAYVGRGAGVCELYISDNFIYHYDNSYIIVLGLSQPIKKGIIIF